MATSTPDPDVLLERGWLPVAVADHLYAALLQELPWAVHRIRMFGRWVDSPRLSCWLGDPGTDYAYSGGTFEPLPWPPILAQLRERLAIALGVPFNSVLANLYRNGRDAMGWHSDDEPELGPRPVIASVSLGGVRRFALKHRRDAALKGVLELPHGSLLVMSGDTQRLYRHALPRTSRVVAPRINLTFRQVDPARRR